MKQLLNSSSMTRFYCWIVCAFLTTATCAQSTQNRRNAVPNILWITCEDMSANLPSYGDRTVATPTIDRLVREGVRYTRMFSTAGVCAPSRSALITGMYQNSIGTQHMRTGKINVKRPDIPSYDAVPPPYVKCFTEYLRGATDRSPTEGGPSYFCTNNSKTDYQFGNPVTAWDENGPKAHWRNRLDKNQPFFSVFNLEVTHESQIWARADKPLRVNPANVKVPPYYPDTPIIRRDLARYYDNIMVMDSLAGNILGQLEADGLLDNTIVVFFSDHGAGLPWYKRELYERGTHVPFVVRFPKEQQAGDAALRPRSAGTTDTELHSFVDLAPTMLSLAGVPIPKHMQGQAFAGEQRAQARQAIFGARDRMDEHYDMVRAMRDERYRYVRNFMPDKPHYQDNTYRKQMPLMQEILRLRDAGQLTGIPARWFLTKSVEELYDLQTDPYELTNLAGRPDHQARLRQMRHALTDWMTDVSDKGALPEREMVNLMYGGKEQPTTAIPTVKLSQPGEAVVLSCPTEGASLAWQLDGDERWQLYHQPVRLPTGRTLRAKAIRYGYVESSVVSWPEKLTDRK